MKSKIDYNDDALFSIDNIELEVIGLIKRYCIIHDIEPSNYQVEQILIRAQKLVQ